MKWGFLPEGEKDFWEYFVFSRIAGAKKEAHEESLVRAIENKHPSVVSDHALPNAFSGYSLRHVTICDGRLTIFFRFTEGLIEVFIIARHKGRGNKVYSGHGSLPGSEKVSRVRIRL
ncbi:MAG: hypothetical protein AAF355_10575 [Myxococcota bacterium]